MGGGPLSSQPVMLQKVCTCHPALFGFGQQLLDTVLRRATDMRPVLFRLEGAIFVLQNLAADSLICMPKATFLQQ